MLNGPGQWVYDAVTGNLYAWLPDSSDPSLKRMEAATRPGIILSNADYNAVLDVSVEKTGGDSVSSVAAKGLTISNLRVTDSGGRGIYVGYRSSGTISSNRLMNLVREGISVDSSEGVLVQNNDVSNAGNVGSPVSSAFGVGAFNSDNVQIIGNKITNVGYNGINFFGNSVVRNNIVINPCLVLNDCAGIYTGDYSNRSAPLIRNSQVSGNYVSGALGNLLGTRGGPQLAFGIYLDESTRRVTVDSNVIAGNASGLSCHNCNENSINANIFYGNLYSQIAFGEDSVRPGLLQGNILSGNTFFPTNSNPSLSLYSAFADLTFGTFSNNKYSTMYSSFVAQTDNSPSYPNAGPTARALYSLSDWQSSGRDTTSATISPFKIAEVVASYAGPNTVTGGDFNAGLGSWYAYSADGLAKLVVAQAAECGQLVPSNCARFEASPATASLAVSPPFSLTKGITYAVSIKGKPVKLGATSGDTSYLIVRRNGPTYENLASSLPFVLPSGWTTQEFYFTSSVDSIQNARIDFQTPAGTTVLFNDVSLREATLRYNDPASESRILSNFTNLRASVPCPDTTELSRCSQYMDTDGKAVSFPISLDPFTAKIIIWGATPFRR
jgi:hypothetical protein